MGFSCVDVSFLCFVAVVANYYLPERHFTSSYTRSDSSHSPVTVIEHGYFWCTPLA